MRSERLLVNIEGITNPPIDDLLTHVDSKYRLVLFAAKRARQINAYYAHLGEGLLENVGPLVESAPQEKPLSIALREIDEGLLTCEDASTEAGQDTPLHAVADPQFSFAADVFADLDVE